MIYYFPQTYMPASRLRFLCKCFPRLSVLQTSEKYVSDDMQQLIDQQHLDIRFPRTIVSEQLQAVLDEFTAWAGMHPKGLGDLKTFFKIQQNQPPLVEDTHPTQIQSQIRQFSRSEDVSQNDSRLLEDLQLQAALFLSLAHCFDEHQDSSSMDLGTVRQMETQMFACLSGDDTSEEVSAVLSTDLSRETPARKTHAKPAEEFRVEEYEKYMVVERIRAWATLAANDPEPAWAYITTRMDVAEAVLDIFPESTVLANWNLGLFEDLDQNSASRPSDLFATMEEFAFARTLPASEKTHLPTPGSIDPADNNVRFYLFGVPHYSPRRALAGLMTGKAGSYESPSLNTEAENTLFGLITGV